jgi:hypothetical protein
MTPTIEYDATRKVYALTIPSLPPFGTVYFSNSRSLQWYISAKLRRDIARATRVWRRNPNSANHQPTNDVSD